MSQWYEYLFAWVIGLFCPFVIGPKTTSLNLKVLTIYVSDILRTFCFILSVTQFVIVKSIAYKKVFLLLLFSLLCLTEFIYVFLEM